MFEVKKHKVIIKNLHQIVDNFYSILNDGDNDILYTGTNQYGNQILGSIVCEDDEIGFIRYFHTLISDRLLTRFLNKEISLRQILEANESFFVVDKDYNGKEIEFNLIQIAEIPTGYLPLADSYCPDVRALASLDYSFSLKGGLSDLHKAEPEVMNSMNSTFYSFLKSSLNFVSSLDINSHIYSETAMTGSFKLNFQIEFRIQNSLFQKPESDIKAFLAKFYNYIFSKLPKESEEDLKSESIQSKNFKELESDFKKIFESRNVFFESNVAAEQKIIDLISYSVENFKEIQYEGFDRIELLNKTEEGIDLPLAIIDKDFYPAVENKFYKIEQLNKEDVIEIDEHPKEYSIQVYQLNTESGKGAAYLNIDDSIHKILLHLKNRSNYHNTIFTKSMDEKSVIKINAIAKKVNGYVTLITYFF